MTMLRGTGILRYDPPRPGLKKKPHKWVVINVDEDITRYFRYWVDKHILNPLGFEKGGLCQPSWGSHISIVRGENDLRHSTVEWELLWRKYEGEEVEFMYSPEVRQTGDRSDDYWFVDVVCPRGVEIREELGLFSKWKFHMTIGRTW